MIHTPELDRLASEGVHFRNAFVTTSICPTSRASILTGQYMRRHGVGDFFDPLSDAQLARSYPSVLREAGYYLGFLGKWGIASESPEALALARRHFDFWAGASHHGNYWHEADCPYVLAEGATTGAPSPCTCPPSGSESRTGNRGIRRPRHLTTEILPAQLEHFLDARDASRPFCLSVSFKAAHAPWSDWDPILRDLYEGQTLPVANTVAATPSEALPELLRDSPSARSGAVLASSPDVLQAYLRDYYRLISGVDLAVGRMRKALAERGLRDDTVIVFSSDNGYLFGEHGLGSKWLMHEASIRVPLLVCDPAAPQPGAVCDELVLNVDLAPTLVALGGAEPPTAMQGRSLVPLLLDPAQPFREDWLYEHHLHTSHHPIARTEGVRGRRWKYVRYLDGDPAREQLFDLATDPGETRDLAGRSEHRERLLSMRRRWRSLRRSLR